MKKIINNILVLFLCFSIMGTTVFATDGTTVQDDENTTDEVVEVEEVETLETEPELVIEDETDEIVEETVEEVVEEVTDEVVNETTEEEVVEETTDKPTKEDKEVKTPYLPMGVEDENNPSDTQYGYRDLNVDSSKFKANELVNNKGTLPSSFSLESSMGAVRNQNPYGTCWTFATVGSAESSAIQQGLISKNDIDLSELQIAYFFYNHQNGDDPLGLLNGDFNNPIGDSFLNLGGNSYLTTFQVAGGMGYINEALLPYNQAANVLNGSYNVDRSLGFENNSYRIDNVKWLSMSDKDAVKQVLYNEGAIAVSYYHDDDYFNSSTNSYYCNETDSTNHAVTLVGWDDNYPSTNFASTPSSNGAWLIRNSWGSNWGDDGYFWISYEDTSICNGDAIHFDVTEASENERIYQYDGTSSPYYYYNQASVQGANVFTATRNEVIEKVGFYTDGADYRYQVDVYTGVNGGPTTGTKVSSASVSGTPSYAGYMTVDLAKAVSVSEGEKFSIVVTITAANPSDDAYMYVDIADSISWMEWVSSSKSGQSYINDGSGWDNVSAEGNCNVRIKAYTIQGLEIVDNVVVAYNGSEDKVVIPEGVVEIADEVFMNKDIYEVVLPSTLKVIGDYAFYGNNLESVVLPAGLETIRELAFADNSIKSIYLPESITGLYLDPFGGNDDLVVYVNQGTYAHTWATNYEYEYVVVNPGVKPILVEGVKINQSSFFANIGESLQLTVSFTPANANAGTGLTWTTENPNVATVDQNGVVTIVGSGVTYVSVLTENGYFATCEVGYGFGAANLNAVTKASSTSLKLSWNRVPEAVGYVVYRSTDNKTFKSVKTITSGNTTTFTNTKLSANKFYYYKVRAYKYNGGTKVYAADSNVFKAIILSTPALTAKSAAYDSIKLSWKTIKNANHYSVYRSTTEKGTYQFVGTTTGLSYVDSGLDTHTKYYYKVKANYGSEYGTIQSSYSAAKYASTKLNTPVFSGKSGDANGQLTVYWNEVPGATSYEVYTATKSSGTYTLVAETSDTYYNDVANIGQTRYYKVKAVREEDGKNYYSSLSSSYYAATITDPKVYAQSVNYKTLEITWDVIDHASGYELYRATSSSGTYKKIATSTNKNDTSFVNTGLTAGKAYYYKVKTYVDYADGSRVYSPYSKVISGKAIPETTTVYTAPATTGVKVSWDKVAGATGYTVYRSTSLNGTYSSVKSVTGLSYTNTGLKANTEYYFKVKAYRTVSGKKIYSNFSEAVCQYPNPAKVTGLAASAQNEYRMKLSWKAVTGATHYEVARLNSTGTYNVLARVPSDVLSYIDTNLVFYRNYSYKVRAIRVNNGLDYVGPYSSIVSARTKVLAPKAKFAERWTMNGLSFEFGDNPNADGFEVYRKKGSSGSYSLTASTAKGNIYYYDNDGEARFFTIDERLTPGSTYYFKVRAYKYDENGKKVYSSYSAVKSCKVTVMKNIGGSYPKTIYFDDGGYMKAKSASFSISNVTSTDATLKMKIKTGAIRAPYYYNYFRMYYVSYGGDSFYIDWDVYFSQYSYSSATITLTLTNTPLEYIYYYFSSDNSPTYSAETARIKQKYEAAGYTATTAKPENMKATVTIEGE